MRMLGVVCPENGFLEDCCVLASCTNDSKYFRCVCLVCSQWRHGRVAGHEARPLLPCPTSGLWSARRATCMWLRNKYQTQQRTTRGRNTGAQCNPRADSLLSKLLLLLHSISNMLSSFEVFISSIQPVFEFESVINTLKTILNSIMMLYSINNELHTAI